MRSHVYAYHQVPDALSRGTPDDRDGGEVEDGIPTFEAGALFVRRAGATTLDEMEYIP